MLKSSPSCSLVAFSTFVAKNKSVVWIFRYQTRFRVCLCLCWFVLCISVLLFVISTNSSQHRYFRCFNCLFKRLLQNYTWRDVNCRSLRTFVCADAEHLIWDRSACEFFIKGHGMEVAVGRFNLFSSEATIL